MLAADLRIEVHLPALLQQQLCAEDLLQLTEAEAWVDYYNDPSREELVFGVHIDLERELQNRGLFAEWVNPGRLAVYEV